MPIAAHTDEPWLSTSTRLGTSLWVTQPQEAATFTVPTYRQGASSVRDDVACQGHHHSGVLQAASLQAQ